MSVAITQHRTVPVAINKDEPNKYQQRILLSDVRRHNCHFAVVGLLSVCVTDLKFQTRSRFFSVFSAARDCNDPASHQFIIYYYIQHSVVLMADCVHENMHRSLLLLLHSLWIFILWWSSAVAAG